jgi:hypothetical protein
MTELPMAIQPQTRDFLNYLQQNKGVRDLIRAERNKTLLYAGEFSGPIWSQVESFQRKHPGAVQILPDVLKSIPAPTGHAGTLKDHVDALTHTVPSNDQLVIWEALSGIFASNAEGTVYFSVGSGIDPMDKVFPSTEISVLMRNPRVSAVPRQLVEYYQRCVREKKTDINTGFMPGDF